MTVPTICVSRHQNWRKEGAAATLLLYVDKTWWNLRVTDGTTWCAVCGKVAIFHIKMTDQFLQSTLIRIWTLWIFWGIYLRGLTKTASSPRNYILDTKKQEELDVLYKPQVRTLRIRTTLYPQNTRCCTEHSQVDYSGNASSTPSATKITSSVS